MTEIQVRPKADKRIAWQYNYGERNTWPEWVENNTKWIDDELFLKRRSGNQLMLHGDWLIKDLDGGIIWCRNVDIWNEWEKVG